LYRKKFPKFEGKKIRIWHKKIHNLVEKFQKIDEKVPNLTEKSSKFDRKKFQNLTEKI